MLQNGKHDQPYFEDIGGDSSRIILNPIDYAEVTLDLVLDIARDIKTYGEIGLVFVDSLRNLPAQQRIEESLAKADFGIEAKVINKFYTELSVLQAKRRVLGKPLTLIATNHESEGHSTMPGAPPPIVIPRGKQQLYGSHMRIRLRNPQYRGSATVAGIKIPFQLECRYIVECNLGGPSKAEGEFRVYQVPFQGSNPGTIEEVDFWWNQGRNTGYIRGGGKSWQITVGDGGEYPFGSKVELFDYWRENKNIYKQDKDAILPLAISFFKEATNTYVKKGGKDSEE